MKSGGSVNIPLMGLGALKINTLSICPLDTVLIGRRSANNRAFIFGVNTNE